MARWLRAGLWLLLGAGVLLALAVAWLDRDRPQTADLGVPVAAAARATDEQVTVTWLGVTTLLIDDGETRILTDGFFSRAGLLDLALDRPVAPDGEAIDRALTEAGVSELAAVLTVHSHYDHAMDAGEVALRTGAVVLGSRSTANVARGAGVPEPRIVEVEPGDTYPFGEFRIRFMASRHVPASASGDPPFPGTIDAPLVPPVPISAWKEGGSYSIWIGHPRGNALIQGSAGFVEGALEGLQADVLMLGIGGLGRLGRDYIADYWREIAGATAARRVFPIHYDDFFSRPYGVVQPPPRLLEDVSGILGWVQALASAATPPASLELLPFHEPVALY